MKSLITRLKSPDISNSDIQSSHSPSFQASTMEFFLNKKKKAISSLNLHYMYFGWSLGYNPRANMIILLVLFFVFVFYNSIVGRIDP